MGLAEAWTIDDGCDTMFAQAIQQALDGRLGSAPLFGIELSKEMYGAHSVGISSKESGLLAVTFGGGLLRAIIAHLRPRGKHEPLILAFSNSEGEREHGSAA